MMYIYTHVTAGDGAGERTVLAPVTAGEKVSSSRTSSFQWLTHKNSPPVNSRVWR